MKDQDKGKGKMRALLARFSLDGHDRGLLSVMSSFRDRGIEVVYTYFSDPKELAKAAEQEDVHAEVQAGPDEDEEHCSRNRANHQPVEKQRLSRRVELLR